MRILFTVLFVFHFTTIIYCQDSKTNRILSHEDFQEIIAKENTTVVLISSITCGYCIKDIKFNNKLVNQFSGNNFNFVMLLEEDINFINKKNGLKSISDKWLILPKAHDSYKRFWEEEMFPEVHIFKKGKQIATFIDASEKTKSDLVKYLKKS